MAEEDTTGAPEGGDEKAADGSQQDAEQAAEGADEPQGAGAEVARKEAAEAAQADDTPVLPLAMWVQGGTTTSGHDEWLAKHDRDAKQRRAVADAERKVASVPIEQGGGRLYSHELGGDPRIPKADKVQLFYVNRKGEVEHEGVGDVLVVTEPAFPGEMFLQLFCPFCLESKRKTPDLCIIRIRQSNRRWGLDDRTKGSQFHSACDGQVYVSAGVVRDSEEFNCPDCHWRAAIDKNKVYTIRRGRR
jgi:hypothetical protein